MSCPRHLWICPNIWTGALGNPGPFTGAHSPFTGGFQALQKGVLSESWRGVSGTDSLGADRDRMAGIRLFGLRSGS
jgi:hypothetical protein